MAGLRRVLGEIAQKTGEFAGIPMPLDGESLVIEPSYPWAEVLSKIGGERVDEKSEREVGEDDQGLRLRNIWFSHHKRCDILMIEKDGRVKFGVKLAIHGIGHQLSTLGCSDAWGLEQEAAAMQLLGTMIRHRQMKQYVLTGTFLERSKRSGVTYMFRRLRPTIALAARPGLPGGGMQMGLCALCMHPIAYYEGSWAGAMCPTDDVIAHLAMMRGDEHMFWKRCNQHPLHRPEAGL